MATLLSCGCPRVNADAEERQRALGCVRFLEPPPVRRQQIAAGEHRDRFGRLFAIDNGQAAHAFADHVVGRFAQRRIRTRPPGEVRHAASDKVAVVFARGGEKKVQPSYLAAVR